MALTEADWQKNINQAMQELDGNSKHGFSARSFTMPNWLPYVACILLGIVVARHWFSTSDAQSINADRNFTMGGKVALLMVAEDIESFRERRGYLPDAPPGSIAKVLEIAYKKLDDVNFELSMPSMGSTLVFSDRHDRLEMME